MMDYDTFARLRDRLIRQAQEALATPPTAVQLTGNPDASQLFNDLLGHPQAFVLARLMGRQIPGERAWRIPTYLHAFNRGWSVGLSLRGSTDVRAEHRWMT